MGQAAVLRPLLGAVLLRLLLSRLLSLRRAHLQDSEQDGAAVVVQVDGVAARPRRRLVPLHQVLQHDEQVPVVRLALCSALVPEHHQAAAHDVGQSHEQALDHGLVRFLALLVLALVEQLAHVRVPQAGVDEHLAMHQIK